MPSKGRPCMDSGGTYRSRSTSTVELQISEHPPHDELAAMTMEQLDRTWVAIATETALGHGIAELCRVLIAVRERYRAAP